MTQIATFARLGLMACALSLLPVGVAAQSKTRGIASYYSDRLHGRRMANGKPYHRDSMTCAHLQFPLGTRLLVTNQRNGRQIVVHVTDRGPYSRRFVIDLSRRAARELGIIGAPFSVVEMVPVGSDYVVPFRITDLDSIPVPQLELEMTPFGDAPAWTEDSLFRNHIDTTQIIQNSLIITKIQQHHDTTPKPRDAVRTRRIRAKKG